MDDRSEFDNPDVGHEESDVSLRAVLTLFAVIAVAAAVIHVLVWLLMLALAPSDLLGTADRSLRAAPPERPPDTIGTDPAGPPLLQANPAADMDRLRAREAAVLQRYGWVDEASGLVQVPIEVAMERMAATAGAGEPPPARDPGR